MAASRCCSSTDGTLSSRASISDSGCGIRAANCGRPVPPASRPATISSTALSRDWPSACIIMESSRPMACATRAAVSSTCCRHSPRVIARVLPMSRQIDFRNRRQRCCRCGPDSYRRSRSGCLASWHPSGDAIAHAFSVNGADSHSTRAPLVVNRAPRPPAAGSQIGVAGSVAAPGRVGIEFYDSAARIGAMASFDVGGAGMGARIMMLFDRHRAALFTAEGLPTRSSGAVTHGPLSLRREGESIVLAFRGPAVIVPDASAYLSIERALASGRLDGDTEVNARFEIDHACGEFDFDRVRPRPKPRTTTRHRALHSGEFRDGFASTAPHGPWTGMRAPEFRSPDWDRRNLPHAG